MKTISITFTAGQSIPFELLGNYFHLLETTAGVDVSFMRDGAEISKAQNMEFGFFAKPEGGFTGLMLSSAAAQSIKIAVGMGDGGYNRTTGSVSIIGNQGAHVQAGVVVTNASGLMLQSRASRRSLIIQNKDAAGNIYVNLSGLAATVANGLKIAPGGSLVLDGYVPWGAVYAIGDIANNANVVVIEG